MENRISGSPMRFEDLEAWKAARDLTNVIYQYCRREPLCRDFGLCDQLKRSGVSSMNNTAEGWESLHVAEKIQFYNFARRSCGEVRSMAYVLIDQSYVSPAEHRQLYDHAVRCGKLVSGLIRASERRK